MPCAAAALSDTFPVHWRYTMLQIEKIGTDIPHAKHPLGGNLDHPGMLCVLLSITSSNHAPWSDPSSAAGAPVDATS